VDAVELWAGSVSRYNEKRRQAARIEWHGWHLDQAARHRRTLEALITYHEARAASLEQPDPRARARSHAATPTQPKPIQREAAM